jgi:glycosyltransferase involved in cell wall biosynthesis
MMELRRLLFHRDFRQPSGGHLKVWDYFQHATKSKCYAPEIYFSPTSVWNSSNPWFGQAVRIKEDWEPLGTDALFLAGLDWLAIPESLRGELDVPVINLIQGIRHADPKDERYLFLKHRAIRICVSEEVAEALRGTRIANGPIYTIPNGLDSSNFPLRQATEQRPYDLFIAGAKNPALARELYNRLAVDGRRVQAAIEFLPRQLYLEYLSKARTSILLPGLTEGFFLPALEAMALETIVVCPDCVGNRSVCIDGDNCFRPQYTSEEIAAAAEKAISLDVDTRRHLLANGTRTRLKHSFERERAAFLDILQNLSEIWTRAVN